MEDLSLLIEMCGGYKPFLLHIFFLEIAVCCLFKAFLTHYFRPETKEEFEATKRMLEEANNPDIDELLGIKKAMKINIIKVKFDF